MLTRPRVALAGALVIAAGLLAACAPSADATAPTPVAETSQSVTATPSPAPTSASIALGDIFGVALGEPFLDAIERTGAAQVQGCSWVARSEQQGYRLQLQGPEAPVEPDTAVDSIAVTAPVGAAAQGPIGPRTAEGIGIGSTPDEVQAAYPNAQETPATDGPQRFLQLDTGTAGETLYFAYSEGTPVIWGMIATSLPAPAHEDCE